MVKGVFRAFRRLLDWQLCTETWTLPISDSQRKIDKLTSKFRDGDNVALELLVFPTDDRVDLEFADGHFVAKPRNFALWLSGFDLMRFQGRAEVQNSSIRIVGTYRVSKLCRVVQAFWSGSIIAIVLLALAMTTVTAFKTTEPPLEIAIDFLKLLAFVGAAVLMLTMAKGLWILTRAVNRPNRSRLEAFLRKITVQDLRK